MLYAYSGILALRRKEILTHATEARDRWALRANGLRSFLVDGYSEMGITGQLREEAQPCPDRR